jgi:signal transduction histidine kinase
VPEGYAAAVLEGLAARARGTRLTARITIVLVVIALLAAINAGRAVRAVHARERSRDRVTDLRTASAGASDMAKGIVDQETGERGFLITGEDSYLQPYVLGGDAVAGARTALAAAGRSDVEIAGALAAVDTALDGWRVEADREIDARRTSGDAAAAIVGQGAGKVLFDGLREAVDDLSNVVAARSDAARADAQRTYDRFVVLVFITLGAVVVMAAGLALLLAHWVTRPVDRLAESVEGVRASGLGDRVAITGPPELRRIGEAADEMRVRLVAQIARAEAATTRAAAANAELEAFSYSVSHDLRAPLRSIDGFSRAIIEDAGDDLSDDLKGHLRRIRANTQRMAELIDDLLELSRVSRVAPDPVLVDVSALAREVVDRLRDGEPGRAVEVVIQPGLRAVADVSLLRIVLENLLGNAWKFTSHQAAPRIELSGDGPPPATEFRVVDNGAGFDQHYADKLFAPFQRLHTDREFPGTGIGLATVARIVHRHGGRIEATGEVGRGATVTFSMAEPTTSDPLTRVPTDGSAAAPAVPDGGPRSAPAPGRVGAPDPRVLEHDHGSA